MGTYLHFSVDGDITAPFIENTGIKEQYQMPLHFFPPILLSSQVKKVVILVPPPSSVVEGDVFPIQPVIQILDQDNNPLPNKLVFAIKIKEQGKTLPNLYSLKDVGKLNILVSMIGYITKELMFPIPGNYDPNFLDPLQSHKFFPIFTNSSGIVTFTNLTFSEKGNAGNSVAGGYTITFICDGVYSNSVDIQVQSKVATVKFLEPPPAKIAIDPNDVTQLTPMLQILTADGNPVQGKVPRFATINTILPNNNGSVIGNIDSGFPTYSATGSDGIFILIYRISLLKINNLQVQLSVAFDDVVAVSEQFELMYDEQTLNTYLCTGINLISPNNSTIPIVN